MSRPYPARFRTLAKSGPLARRLKMEPLEDRRMLSVLFVDADAAAGGNGLAWASAYQDLEDALAEAKTLNADADTANDVDQIWIAEGVYRPSAELEPGDARSASFSLVDGVTLYGGFEGTEGVLGERDWATHETVLSGDLGVADEAADNAYTVAYCREDITAGVNGVSIVDGNADGEHALDYRLRTNGGAVFNEGTLTILNSTVSRNAAVSGGGIYNAYTGDLTVVNSRFTGNSCIWSGGGIYARGESAITNSVFSGNSATSGGAICGLYFDSVAVNHSTLAGNSAESGGGIYVHSGQLTLVNSIVAMNGSNDIWGMVTEDSTGDLISMDPKFVRNPGTNGVDDYGDLRITSESPAINSGDFAVIPADELDLDADGNTSELLPLDTLGYPRVFGGSIDIGAFEYQAAPAEGREAASLRVTTATDTVDLYDGLISLREAIHYAHTSSIEGPIDFAPELSGAPLVLGGSSLSVADEVTIDASSLLQGFTIDANAASRVLTVVAAADNPVELINLSLTNGRSEDGGGIHNSGTLLLTDSTVSRNWAKGEGGGIFNTSTGTMIATNSTISLNSAEHGGALFNDPYGAVTFRNCELSGNVAAGDGGAIYNKTAPISIVNSTLAGNAAGRYGGGIRNRDNGSVVQIDNTIIARNEAETEHPDVSDPANTVSGANNLIGDGSGLAQLIDGQNGNRIGTSETPLDPRFVLNPSDGSDGWGDDPWTPDIDESVNDTCGILFLQPDSPAIDSGNDALVPLDVHDLDGDGNVDEPIPFDLPGYARKRDGDGDGSATVDIGAYEFFVFDPPIPMELSLPPSATEGDPPVQATLTLNDPLLIDVVVSLSSDDTTEAFVPESVILPAGHVSIAFPVTILDDSEIDGSQGVTVTAAALGFTGHATAIEVLDNENRDIVVSFPLSAAEGDDPIEGTVCISGTLPTDLIVNLFSDDATEATIPPTITIAAGQTSAPVILSIVDDAEIDASQAVTITASAAGFEDGSCMVDVLDNEDRALVVELPPVATEADGEINGTVRISGTLPADLTVALSSSDSSEAVPPETVTIPAGDTTATFALSVVDDAVPDRNQVATITATAPEFSAGSATLVILDDDPFEGPVLYVDADAAPGGNGWLWESALGDLQEAITEANALNSDANPDNDIHQIWIAEGTYIPSVELYQADPRSVTFSLPHGVALIGGFSGTETTLASRDWIANRTILSGDIGVAGDASDNAFSVVYCGEDVESAIDGVTVVGGNANGQRIYRPDEQSGGAVANLGTLTISNAVFVGNSASENGGAIYSHDATLRINSSQFAGNSTGKLGGGVYARGTLEIASSTLAGNSAGTEGGGVYHTHGEFTLTNSLIALNNGDELKDTAYLTGASTNNLIGVDPKFVRNPGTDGPEDYGDLHLTEDSSAIDVGDSERLPMDEHDLDGDGDTDEPVPLDAGGAPRLFGGSVDIGAFEFQSTPSSDHETASTRVTTASDSFDCFDNQISLREALYYSATALDGAPITFAAELSGSRITLNGTSLFVDRGVEIDASSLAEGLTIDGDGRSRIFTIIAPAEEPVRLTDLTMINGSATLGGGVYIHSGTLTVTDCAIVENDGAGLFSDSSDVRIDNSVLSRNRAGSGGGVWSEDGTLELVDCLISENQASLYGGGIHLDWTKATLENCILSRNEAWDGAAINNYYGELDVMNCTIAGNWADSSGAGVFNWGKSNDWGTARFTNTTICGNSADSSGGGIYNNGGIVLMTNSTVAGNVAKYGGGLYLSSAQSETRLYNTIVARNEASEGPDIRLYSGSLSGSNNLIGDKSGQYWLVNGLNGNLVGTYYAPIDPRFVRNPSDGGDGWCDDLDTPDVDESANDDFGDLRLRSDSPAIEAGDDQLLPADTADWDNDGDVDEPIPMDRAGFSRVHDGDDDETATVDMGAYEFFVFDPPLVLEMTLDDTSTEGDGPLQGTVRILETLPFDLALTLSSTDTTEAVARETVIIPAGETSCVFSILIQEDIEVDGTQEATIIATASESAWVTHTIQVLDNEPRDIIVDIPNSTTEGDGSVQGTVQLCGTAFGDVTIDLSSGDSTEVTVPATVTIRHGRNSASFSVSVVDDTEIDDIQTAVITAAAPGFTAGSDTIEVADNESRQIVVEVPESATESDGVVEGMAFLSGTLQDDLVLILSSGDTSGATVPESVIIPAGETSVSFPVSIVNDDEIDAPEMVTITAVAAGFTAGSDEIQIINDDLPPSPILYVDIDAPSSGDGTGWSTAIDDLQTALAEAARLNSYSVGENYIDAIWIAAGAYTPSAEVIAGVPRSATFSLLDGVSLHGGFAGDETSLDSRDCLANETILSGDLSAVDSSLGHAYTVVFCGEGVVATIDGLSITGGRANANTSLDLAGGGSGGGIYSMGELTVTNSRIFGNSATYGGGGVLQSGGTMSLSDSTVTENTARWGGGICVSDGELTIDRTSVATNSAEEGGGIHNQGILVINASNIRENTAEEGGGMRNTGSTEVVDSDFFQNEASDFGGAVLNEGGNGNLSISKSEFRGNTSEIGGAIYNLAFGGCPTLAISNTVFRGNKAQSDGACICSSGHVTITNSTLVHNVAGRMGGGIKDFYSSATTVLNNTVVAGNVAPSSPDLVGSGFTGSNNLIGDGSGQAQFIDGQDGNLVGTSEYPLDPRFIRNPSDGGDGWGDDWLTPDIDESTNDDLGDLRLRSNSPAIDAGDNSLLPADVFDLDGDGNIEEPMPVDFSGGARVTDGDGDGVATVDIGAYEFFAGDLNNDGFVGSADLDLVRAYWGQNVSPGDLRSGDANGDGKVGGADLDIVRANWGAGMPAAAAMGVDGLTRELEPSVDLYGPVRREDTSEGRRHDALFANQRAVAEAAWADAVEALRARRDRREADVVDAVLSGWNDG